MSTVEFKLNEIVNKGRCESIQVISGPAFWKCNKTYLTIIGLIYCIRYVLTPFPKPKGCMLRYPGGK